MNKLLLPLVRILSLLSFTRALIQAQPVLQNIQITDSYTKTEECTDPDHWFIIEGQLSIPKGSQKSISFQVPEAFESFPSESFSIEYNSNSAATISRSDESTNNFTISIPEKISEDITTTFNFLAQLTLDAKSKVTEPKSIVYSFYSEGEMFNNIIDYVAKNISAITTNGGIYKTNNTAWFTVDLPMSTFSQPVYLTSQASSSSGYEFNTMLTKFEVITTVDSFNEPVESIPYTSVHDYSTGNQIKCLFNSTVSGGLYLRVTYFTKDLFSSPISNAVELIYPDERTSEKPLNKRDTSTTLGSELYSESTANIDSATGDEITSSNAAMAPTYLNSTHSSYASQSSVIPSLKSQISASSNNASNALQTSSSVTSLVHSGSIPSNAEASSTVIVSTGTHSSAYGTEQVSVEVSKASSAPSSSNSTLPTPSSTQSFIVTQKSTSSASLPAIENSYVSNSTIAATQSVTTTSLSGNYTTVAVSSIEQSASTASVSNITIAVLSSNTKHTLSHSYVSNSTVAPSSSIVKSITSVPYLANSTTSAAAQSATTAPFASNFSVASPSSGITNTSSVETITSSLSSGPFVSNITVASESYRLSTTTESAQLIEIGSLIPISTITTNTTALPTNRTGNYNLISSTEKAQAATNKGSPTVSTINTRAVTVVANSRNVTSSLNSVSGSLQTTYGNSPLSTSIINTKVAAAATGRNGSSSSAPPNNSNQTTATVTDRSGAYSITLSTESAQVTEYGSLFPISTLPKSAFTTVSGKNSTSSFVSSTKLTQATATATDKGNSYSVISSTESALVTEYGSLLPISTLEKSTVIMGTDKDGSYTLTTYTKSAEATEYSGLIPISTIAGSYVYTLTDESVVDSYRTTVDAAQYAKHTSLVAVSTIKNSKASLSTEESVVTDYSTTVGAAQYAQHTSLVAVSTIKNSKASLSTEESVVTGYSTTVDAAQYAKHTSLVAVSTIKNSKASLSTEESVVTDYSTTVGAAQYAKHTSLVPVDTLKISTLQESTVTGVCATCTTTSPFHSVTLDAYTTLTSSKESLSTIITWYSSSAIKPPSVSTYMGAANQLNISIGGLLLGIISFLL